jgi:hypothetical protein
VRAKEKIRFKKGKIPFQKRKNSVSKKEKFRFGKGKIPFPHTALIDPGGTHESEWVLTHRVSVQWMKAYIPSPGFSIASSETAEADQGSTLVV